MRKVIYQSMLKFINKFLQAWTNVVQNYPNYRLCRGPGAGVGLPTCKIGTIKNSVVTQKKKIDRLKHPSQKCWYKGSSQPRIMNHDKLGAIQQTMYVDKHGEGGLPNVYAIMYISLETDAKNILLALK